MVGRRKRMDRAELEQYMKEARGSCGAEKACVSRVGPKD